MLISYKDEPLIMNGTFRVNQLFLYYHVFAKVFYIMTLLRLVNVWILNVQITQNTIFVFLIIPRDKERQTRNDRNDVSFYGLLANTSVSMLMFSTCFSLSTALV